MTDFKHLSPQRVANGFRRISQSLRALPILAEISGGVAGEDLANEALSPLLAICKRKKYPHHIMTLDLIESTLKDYLDAPVRSVAVNMPIPAWQFLARQQWPTKSGTLIFCMGRLYCLEHSRELYEAILDACETRIYNRTLRIGRYYENMSDFLAEEIRYFGYAEWRAIKECTRHLEMWVK